MCAFPPYFFPCIICVFFSHVYYNHFFPRIKCACLNVCIPTLFLHMHNMRLFSHVYHKHFFQRIKCAFFNVCIPTLFLPMHNMRFFPRILCAFLHTRKMRISFLCFLPCLIFFFAHVYAFFPYMK